MLLALATLVVAGLSSANNADQARGRQHRLRRQLGLQVNDTRSAMQKKWDWIRKERPWSVPSSSGPTGCRTSPTRRGGRRPITRCWTGSPGH